MLILRSEMTGLQRILRERGAHREGGASVRRPHRRLGLPVPRPVFDAPASAGRDLHEAVLVRRERAPAPVFLAEKEGAVCLGPDLRKEAGRRTQHCNHLLPSRVTLRREGPCTRGGDRAQKQRRTWPRLSDEVCDLSERQGPGLLTGCWPSAGHRLRAAHTGPHLIRQSSWE